MKARLATSLVVGALLTAMSSGSVSAQPPGAGNGPLEMAISINGIEDSCSAAYYDPPPGVEDFLGTGDPGTATVRVTTGKGGTTAICQTHDHENDREVGYTQDCWLHMPDGDWNPGRGTVVATDRLWTDAEGLPTSRVTIRCKFGVDSFDPN